MRGMLIALTLLAGSAAYADDAADARTHYEEGTKLYDLGRYKEAAHEYEEAFRLKPDPALLFNIGQAYRQAGDDEAALGAYRGFLRRFPEYENRAEVEGYIRTLQQRLDDKRKAAEQATPPATTTPPVTAPPPAAAPAPATTAPVVVAPVAAAPPPREHVPAYKKWWLWTIVGVVVLGGGAAALAVALTTPKNAPSPPGTMTLVFP